MSKVLARFTVFKGGFIAGHMIEAGAGENQGDVQLEEGRTYEVNGDDMNWTIGPVSSIHRQDDPRKEEWIDWSGGECPVLGDVVVSVKLRCGAASSGERGSRWRWEHERVPHGGDIVAYKVVS